jgi:hypothetical protein
MRITWWDPSLPHQLDVRFVSGRGGQIQAFCNCGEIFMTNTVVDARDAIAAYQSHMNTIEHKLATKHKK